MCAPSNKAVDELTARIHATGLRVVRLFSRRFEDMESPVAFLGLHSQVINGVHSSELKELQEKMDKQDDLCLYYEKQYRQLWRRSENNVLEVFKYFVFNIVMKKKMKLSNKFL